MSSADSNFVQPSIPRFDGHYDHWSMLMENFLRSKEYWQVVEKGVAAPVNAQPLEIETLKLKDLKAKNYLFQAIDRPILETILCKDTSKDIWDSMKRKYEGTTRVKRAQLQALRRDFETLQMKDGESVTSYCGRTLEISNKMRLYGEKMQDVTIVEKILRSLTSKFDYVVCSIEESKDIDALSLDELQSSLLVHEQRMNRSSTSEAQALKASTITHSSNFRGRGRGRGQGRGRGRGHGRGRGDRGHRDDKGEEDEFQGRHEERDQKFDKSKVECFRCHKFGHYRSECYARLPNKEKGEKSNFAEQKAEDTLLMAYQVTEAPHSNIWYVDTGCSNHMCGRKSLFSSLDESFNSTVSFGDCSTVKVLGKGNIKIKTKNGFVETISDVYYVPDLKSNLLSGGQLQEKGYTITFQNRTCEIYDPSRGAIAVIPMTSNRLFPLKIMSVQSCLLANEKDVSWLWHYRYGHLNFGGLKTLHQKNMVTGLPQISAPSQVCEECVVGKQPRSQFPQGKSWRAKEVLELIHSDICGPITPTSNGGKKYFITFIDDFTRKTWVYFLQEKNEAFNVFKRFKAQIEKEAGKMIKTLRTDRGGEYCSKEFANFCEQFGIRRELTAAYTPQQNGVSERKNRTILNMVRSLLAKGKVPKNFWPEAVNWSIHVLNRCPTFSVQNMTPQEAWSRRKPAVDHFRIFGCIAYAHVPDEKRKKLDDKSEKCVFLGVSEQSKAYKLFNPLTNKIVISRDVIFDEDSTWNWNGQQPSQINCDDEIEDEKEQVPHLENTTIATLEHSPNGAVAPTTIIMEESRASRARKRPSWMVDYVSGDDLSDDDSVAHLALFADCDPLTFEEADKDKKWQIAMDEEIKSIEKNNTWELVELPKGQKSIGVKWVYKTKLNKDGEVDKYKARLVVKGYRQEFGIDYKEVFAPVARLDTVRLVLAMAAQNSWQVYQLDVKSAFLHGELQEEVYVDQPLGYVQKGSEEKVYKLKKALYGLKQAPRAWYSRINAYFSKEDFQKCSHEHTLFTKFGKDGKILIVSLYVDDLIYTGNDIGMIDAFKENMMKEFEMSDLGLMHYFLGIEVMQSSSGIFISQKKYVLEILDRFRMRDCNPVRTPVECGLKLVKDDGGKKVNATFFKQMVGSLMYLTSTRPDIMHGVSLISRYMENPTENHLLAAKRIFRYLKGTIDFGIFYKANPKEKFHGFSDSDYAGDLDDRKSTSGFVFMMSDGAISWSSKKQPIVTLSTTEAEFVAAAACSCQAIWLRRLIETIQNQEKGPTTIYCDNVSAIKISKNPTLHGRSKHIDVRYHFLRDLCNNDTIDLVFCKSEDQVADIFTKPLKQDLFMKLRKMLGVCSMEDFVHGRA